MPIKGNRQFWHAAAGLLVGRAALAFLTWICFWLQLDIATTAAPFIDEVYAQQVVSVSAYTFLDDMLCILSSALTVRCRRAPDWPLGSTPRARARSAGLPRRAGGSHWSRILTSIR